MNRKKEKYPKTSYDGKGLNMADLKNRKIQRNAPTSQGHICMSSSFSGHSSMFTTRRHKPQCLYYFFSFFLPFFLSPFFSDICIHTLIQITCSEDIHCCRMTQSQTGQTSKKKIQKNQKYITCFPLKKLLKGKGKIDQTSARNQSYDHSLTSSK